MIPIAPSRTILLLAGVFICSSFSTQTAIAEQAALTRNPLDLLIGLNPNLGLDDAGQLPMKLRSLCADPYRFFRGTADVFYLWASKHCQDWLRMQDCAVLLHGDVHPGNVGVYQSHGPGGLELHFSTVDLDEVFRGPFQLDLLRAAVSLRFTAEANDLALTDEEWKSLCSAMCQEYAKSWRGERDPFQSYDDHELIREVMAKARESDQENYIDQFCHREPRLRFRLAKREKNKVTDFMEPVSAALRGEIVRALWQYMNHNGDTNTVRGCFGFDSREALSKAVMDVARWTRMGSSGSQGLSKYLVLLERPTVTGREPLILQLKEEPVPAVARVGLIAPTSRLDRARFVAEAYGRMQEHPRWLVGYTTLQGRGYLVKPKSPRAKELSAKDLNTKARLKDAASLLGGLLGRVHVHSRNGLNGRCADEKPVSGRLQGLHETLEIRSRRVHQFLLEQYRLLRADPAAAELLAKSQKMIEDR